MADFGLREFAREVGVSLSAVQKAIKSGRLVRNSDGRLDESQLKTWDDLRDPAKVRDPAPSAKTQPAKAPSDPTFQKAKTQREVYVSLTKKLEFERLSGKLVEVDAVKVAAFRVFREVRDGILNIPDRVSAEAAAEIVKLIKGKLPQAEVERIVHHVWDRESRDILQKLSKGLDL